MKATTQSANNSRGIPMIKLVLMLAPLVTSLPLAMDIYTPALPGIAHLFNVSAGVMQITLSIFLFSSAIMQLIYGPLADRFGRRPIGMIASFIYGIGSIFCAGSHSITALMLSRLIQSLGACGMMVVGMAVVRDCYNSEKSAKAYSYINGLIGFSPMFAPFIGSYLDIEFGWPSTFLALIVIAASAILFLIMLPETSPKNTNKIEAKAISRKYVEIFKDPQFLIYSLSGACCVCYLFLYCSLSPYLILHQLHIAEKDYGFYFCVMGIAILIGSSISSQLVTRIGIYQSTRLGAIISLIGGILMAAWYLIGGLQIMGWIIPMLVIGCGGTITMGATAGGALHAYKASAGAASALNGALRFLLPPIVASIVIIGDVRTSLPLALPAIIFSILILITFSYARKYLDLRADGNTAGN